MRIGKWVYETEIGEQVKSNTKIVRTWRDVLQSCKNALQAHGREVDNEAFYPLPNNPRESSMLYKPIIVPYKFEKTREAFTSTRSITNYPD